VCIAASAASAKAAASAHTTTAHTATAHTTTAHTATAGTTDTQHDTHPQQPVASEEDVGRASPAALRATTFASRTTHGDEWLVRDVVLVCDTRSRAVRVL
jgi:hypothetical protein